MVTLNAHEFDKPVAPLCVGKRTPDGWKIWLAAGGVGMLMDLDKAELLAIDMQRTIAAMRQANRRGEIPLGMDREQ